MPRVSDAALKARRENLLRLFASKTDEFGTGEERTQKVMAKLPGNAPVKAWEEFFNGLFAGDKVKVLQADAMVLAPLLGVSAHELLNPAPQTEDRGPTAATPTNKAGLAYQKLLTDRTLTHHDVATLLAKDGAEVATLEAALAGLLIDEEPEADLQLLERLVKEYELDPTEFGLPAATKPAPKKPAAKKPAHAKPAPPKKPAAKTKPPQPVVMKGSLPLTMSVAGRLALLKPVIVRSADGFHAPLPDDLVLDTLWAEAGGTPLSDRQKKKVNQAKKAAATTAPVTEETSGGPVFDASLAAKSVAAGAIIQRLTQGGFRVSIPARLMVEVLWATVAAPK